VGVVGWLVVGVVGERMGMARGGGHRKQWSVPTRPLPTAKPNNPASDAKQLVAALAEMDAAPDHGSSIVCYHVETGWLQCAASCVTLMPDSSTSHSPPVTTQQPSSRADEPLCMYSAYTSTRTRTHRRKTRLRYMRRYIPLRVAPLDCIEWLSMIAVIRYRPRSHVTTG